MNVIANEVKLSPNVRYAVDLTLNWLHSLIAGGGFAIARHDDLNFGGSLRFSP